MNLPFTTKVNLTALKITIVRRSKMENATKWVFLKEISFVDFTI